MSLLQDWNITSEQGLRPGITLLEASAGTGKTYNITSLILRLVAEQKVKMREIVVVTFTRAATAELKDRIRVRISEAVEVLEGRKPPADDEVLTFLLAGSQAQGVDWLRNLRMAQESFDECLISTIHGFCQRMLQQNAFESRTDFDLELMDEVSTIRDEVVDDWLSNNLHPENPSRYAFLTQRCGFNRSTLLSLADKALSDPDVEVLPASDERTEAGWDAERDSLLASWEAGWGASLPTFYEDAHARGVFAKKGQRTYRKTRCAQEVDAVTAWLRSRPSVVDPLLTANYWSSETLQGFLADGQPAPVHEGIEALRELLRYPDRLAACEKAAFVHWIRREFDTRMRARRMQSYQDLMRNLARVLSERDHPSRNALVHAMGSRFKAALIDEFQDTDVLQWNIFREVFDNDRHWLYLIGDPKQAIYGFRGANVHVYLAAKKSAKDRCFTMRRNFRSDTRIVDAFNHWMGVSGFFAELGIDYVQILANVARDQPVDRIRYREPRNNPYAAPLQVRFVDRRLLGACAVSDDDASVDKASVGTFIPTRVADDMVALLSSGVRLFDPTHRTADKDGFRALRAGDLAVLTRTGLQAAQVQRALTQADIASVLQGAESVLASDDALDLQRWLEALAAPGRDGPARTAATTRLFGRDATLIARLDEQDPNALKHWEQWLAKLVHWRDVFAKSGFLRAFRVSLQDDLLACPIEGQAPDDVTTRLLRHPQGDRHLTNLWHLAELLHAAETSQRLHLAGLLAWLKRQRVEATVDVETLETRLERDDEAVSLMTMHKAKGLEFPVVFVPYLWDGKGPLVDEPLLLPKDGCPQKRVLDLRASEERAQAFDRAWQENHKEQLRLLYVACTRAKYRCVLYTGHIHLLQKSALAPALHGEPRTELLGRIAAGTDRAAQSTRSALWSDIAQLATGSASSLADHFPTVALSHCDRPQATRWAQPEEPNEALLTRDFCRFGLDHSWRRHSFTSLAHASNAVKSYDTDKQEGLDRDEEQLLVEGTERPIDQAALPLYEIPAGAVAVPLADFPCGADAGTFFHSIFELADFRWADPTYAHESGAALLRDLIDRLLPAHGFDAARWVDPLLDGVLRVLRTPLGGPLAHARLCDIAPSVRLNEFRFDFPIAGGNAFGSESHRTRVAFRALVGALRSRTAAHNATPDLDAIRGAYLDNLSLSGDLAGFMTGSMDLVFQHPVQETPKWFLVDHKSNRLDPHRLSLVSVDNFCPEAMRFEMERCHYYLQYHIYVVALHRYLRLRLGKKYDYDANVGGVYYLFLRGMVGQDTPLLQGRRHGCFFDKPPRAVIEALDGLFDQPNRSVAGGAS